jgi:hypothetical protein
MPRFFFNVHIVDKEGMELPGPDEARSQAIIASSEMMRDKGREFWPGTEWTMQVTDEEGETVCVLKFSARR